MKDMGNKEYDELKKLIKQIQVRHAEFTQTTTTKLYYQY